MRSAEKWASEDASHAAVLRDATREGAGPPADKRTPDVDREAVKRGLVELRFRHRVDELVVGAGAVTGVSGKVLEACSTHRGQESTRTEMGEFELAAPIVIATSGGIGGNHDLVREKWPKRLGEPPARMLSGVRAHVDGRMIEIAGRTPTPRPRASARS